MWLWSPSRKDCLPILGSKGSAPTWQAGTVISAMPPLNRKKLPRCCQNRKIFLSLPLTHPHTHPQSVKCFSPLFLLLLGKTRTTVSINFLFRDRQDFKIFYCSVVIWDKQSFVFLDSAVAQQGVLPAVPGSATEPYPLLPLKGRAGAGGCCLSSFPR